MDISQVTDPVQARQLLEQTQWRQNSRGSADELAWTCPHCQQVVRPGQFELNGSARYYRQPVCDCPGAQVEEAEKRRQERDRERVEAYNDLMRRIGVQDGIYRRMTFENWDTTRHSQAAKHLADVLAYANGVSRTGPNFAYFWGIYGTGKTHLAIAALRQIALAHMDDNGDFRYPGWRPAFVEWATQCSLVQQSWDDDNSGPTEGQLWARMNRADILVIDDLDKRQPTEWAIGKLYEVIQYRYTREKATIITANHSLEHLQALWSDSRRPEHVRDTGGAILSRILGALEVAIEFTGDDQRMK